MLESQKIVEQFDRDGFAVIRNVIDAGLVEEMGRHVQWLLRRYPDLRPEHLHHPLIRNDAFWVRAVSDERLLDVAQLFLGPDIACFTAHYICKPPRTGHPVLWHQDGAYWKLDPMDALTVWVAVDASTPENGCVRMIPGSHRVALEAPERRVDKDNMLYSQTREALVEEWVERAGIVDVVLNPGDVSIHSPHILHCSEPNTSPRRRCGLDIGYMRATTRIANEGLYLDPILVRGSSVAGINRYRAYPDYHPEETIAFAGHAQWNGRAAAHNARMGLASASALPEAPIETTRRMIRRLQEGTVKQ